MLKFRTVHPTFGMRYLSCLMDKSTALTWIGRTMQGGVVDAVLEMGKVIADNKSADHLIRGQKPQATRKGENLCNVVKRQKGAVIGEIKFAPIPCKQWHPRPPKRPLVVQSAPSIEDQTKANLRKQIAELEQFILTGPKHHHLNALTEVMIKQAEEMMKD